MKIITRGYGVDMSVNEKFNAKAQAVNATITRGTGKVPGMPRDLVAQPGPRGVLLNWRMPEGFGADIAGWRIYKDNESSLFAAINNPGTTQQFIESTAGTNPPTINLFVSSINKLGVESPKASVKAAPISETGAPAMPLTPDSFTTPYTQ